jgi:hypothetical protein
MSQSFSRIVMVGPTSVMKHGTRRGNFIVPHAHPDIQSRDALQQPGQDFEAGLLRRAKSLNLVHHSCCHNGRGTMSSTRWPWKMGNVGRNSANFRIRKVSRMRALDLGWDNLSYNALHKILPAYSSHHRSVGFLKKQSGVSGRGHLRRRQVTSLVFQMRRAARADRRDNYGCGAAHKDKQYHVVLWARSNRVKQAVLRFSDVGQNSFTIILRVSLPHVSPGRSFCLIMPCISVFPFQTVSHMYSVPPSSLINSDF